MQAQVNNDKHSLDNSSGLQAKAGENNRMVNMEIGVPSAPIESHQNDLDGTDCTMVDGTSDHCMELIKLKTMEEEELSREYPCNQHNVVDKGLIAEDVECVNETPGIWEGQTSDMNR